MRIGNLYNDILYYFQLMVIGRLILNGGKIPRVQEVVAEDLVVWSAIVNVMDLMVEAALVSEVATKLNPSPVIPKLAPLMEFGGHGRNSQVVKHAV